MQENFEDGKLIFNGVNRISDLDFTTTGNAKIISLLEKNISKTEMAIFTKDEYPWGTQTWQLKQTKCYGANYAKLKFNNVSTSNLCTTSTLGMQKLWLLLTSGHCSEVSLCNEHRKLDPKIMIIVGRWSLFVDGRYLSLGSLLNWDLILFCIT